MASYSEFSSRFENVSNKISALDTIVKERLNDKIDILKEISFGKSYLEQKDEVLKILNSLQEKSQEKVKKNFEVLLTALINEVLPEDKGEVKIETSIKNNKPHLDICLLRDGKMENIYSDNGGALTNVVSAGLRFIVLKNTSNRKFLIFDEADAWIKPTNIPAFANVIGNMSRKLGVQVVMISHHDPSYFMDHANVIELKKGKGGAIKSEIISEVEEDLDNINHSPFKAIKLRGFKSHINTSIELSPYVTVITGENNIGKSHISRAFKAMMNADNSSANVNHNSSSCHVALTLSDNTDVVWEYDTKAKKKTLYYVQSSSGEILERSDAGSFVPDWLNEYLHMPLVFNYDIHYMDQKNPVFMIGSDVKGHERAEILSLGSEESYVKRMIKNHNDKVKFYQSEQRVLTKRLNFIERDLGVLRNQVKAVEEYSKLKDVNNELVKNNSVMEKLNKSLVSLNVKEEMTDFIKKALLKEEAVDLSISDITAIRENIIKINKKKEMVDLIASIEDNKFLEAIDIESEEKLKIANKVSFKRDVFNSIGKAIKFFDDTLLEELANITPIRDLSVKNKTSNEKIKEIEESISKFTKDHSHITSEMHEIFEKLGGVCPMCNSKVNN